MADPAGKHLFSSIMDYFISDVIEGMVHTTAMKVGERVARDAQSAVSNAFIEHFGNDSGHHARYGKLVQYLINPVKYLRREFCLAWKDEAAGPLNQQVKPVIDNDLFKACESASAIIETFRAKVGNSSFKVRDLQNHFLNHARAPVAEGALNAFFSHVTLVSKAGSLAAGLEKTPKNNRVYFDRFIESFNKEYRSFQKEHVSNSEKFYDKVDGLMQRRMEAEWQVICGCPATCPLCNAKCCEADPKHATQHSTKHRCFKHMVSGFGGCGVYGESDRPSWLVCCGPDVASRGIVWAADEKRGSVHEYFKAEAPGEQIVFDLFYSPG